jgi:hypothetical protein
MAVYRGLGVLALSVLALAHVDGCELDAAEQLAGEAERPVEELARGESPFAALPLLARGRLFEGCGDTAAARAAFARAVVLAGRGGRRLEFAHALLLLARLERCRDHVEACSLARAARATLATCPDPGVLTELLTTTERALQLTAPPRAAGAGRPRTERARGCRVAPARQRPVATRDRGAAVRLVQHGQSAQPVDLPQARRLHPRAEAVARSRELLLPRTTAGRRCLGGGRPPRPAERSSSKRTLTWTKRCAAEGGNAAEAKHCHNGGRQSPAERRGRLTCSPPRRRTLSGPAL